MSGKKEELSAKTIQDTANNLKTVDPYKGMGEEISKMSPERAKNTAAYYADGNGSRTIVEINHRTNKMNQQKEQTERAKQKAAEKEMTEMKEMKEMSGKKNVKKSAPTIKHPLQ